ncbi:MAG: WD40-repeat-containing domain protein [Benniella sp.]|nr:MAG: WD40-repeat-containing domain protein [Benniella sp.]
MVFGTIISSSRGALSLPQKLRLSKFYLENAHKESDAKVALVFCYDAELTLSSLKKAARNTLKQTVREEIADVYTDLGNLMDSLGNRREARDFHKKAEVWRGRASEPTVPALVRSNSAPQPANVGLPSTPAARVNSPIIKPPPRLSRFRGIGVATSLQHIFSRNLGPPAIGFKPLEPDARLEGIRQLALCLGLLKNSQEIDDTMDPIALNWLESTKDDPDEQERLRTLATDVVRAFKREELKDAKAVTEVLCLAPVLEKDDFRYLLNEFCSEIEQSTLLDVHQLEGLAQLLQGADPGQLDADDLVKVLELLSKRLRDTHKQSTSHLYQLTLAISHVLDAMADANIEGLDREKMHEPLLAYLEELKGSTDTYLVYQAAYAYQALLYVPDNETPWQAVLRRTGKVIQGMAGLVTAVKGLDIDRFIESLGKVHQGVTGVSRAVQSVKTAYDGVTSLVTSGQGFFECLKEGLSFSHKCPWYPALRGADTLIRAGQLTEFKKLVCEAPCRLDPAFQWGVCQRLGDLAANPAWDSETRQDAITFLGEIYANDKTWGRQANVKQWILSILMQLSIRSGDEREYTGALLQELRQNGDAKKQALYRECQDYGPGSYPLKVALPELGYPSLLDRIQDRPDVEGALRQLRRRRIKERGFAVYISPQAKANLQARDDTLFPLMDKVEKFVAGDEKVFLILGASGAGKSTFSRELECHLWQSYEKKSGSIPLYINLPSIDKPEHDMIAKQLRMMDFKEPQIRELKLYRKFILICDGYDESRQTHNLYTSNRINESGEWNAKMVVSCRSEYVGTHYRDRFQPGDRNRRSDALWFQEAVIAPFSMNQIENYIDQYVSMHRPPWKAEDYKKALDLVPNLRDLVKNPFLMSLSLEVLPRMVDPGQGIPVDRVTRVALYDQFIEHWLDRGKKRLREKKLSPQARAAFESLSEEGFTQNGLEFMKKLSTAVYKEQNGQPVVRYTRYKDEGSWKAAFFSREDEKQLLREACPLMRTGNQHRFIHRSLLEYGLALAVFDPQDWMARAPHDSMPSRRRSESALSFMLDVNEEDQVETVGHDPVLDSPLVWRSFVHEPLIIEFLAERVQQEPVFKQQLLDYIEQSKTDKNCRKAAANAITILIQAGMQFNGEDLSGIQIPGADLSYGMFDSADLNGADLRHVELRSVWLRRANLSKAQMTGVQFRELPYLKHESPVLSSALSPDWDTMAVGLKDAKINVYSTKKWGHLWTLSGHTDLVASVVFSPDGNQIASGSQDGKVKIWEVASGTCSRTLTGHGKRVQCVVYSPHGDKLVSGSHDMTLRLWKVETGECLRSLRGHTDIVLQVVFSPEGDQIASCSEDNTILLWKVGLGTPQHTLAGHDDIVNQVAYSPKGDRIASASDDRKVQLWNAESGKHLRTFEHTGYVSFVAYSPKGGQIAAGSLDSTLRLWDVETGECLHVLDEHSGYITSVTYSPCGDQLASTSYDRTIRLWDVATGTCCQTLSGHGDVVESAVYSPIGDRIISRGGDMTVRLWDVGVGGSRRIPREQNYSVLFIVYWNKGHRIASCNSDQTIRIWDMDTGDCLHTLRGHTNVVNTVAFSHQGDQIASGGMDGELRFWSVETGSCQHALKVLDEHDNGIFSVSYLRQGNLVASAGADKKIRLWDAHTGECRKTLAGHDNWIGIIACSPQVNHIASCGDEDTIRLWDMEVIDTHQDPKTLSGHIGRVRTVEYSPKGDLIASAGDDGTIRLWDAITGELNHTLLDHTDYVSLVAFSPIGDQVASGGSDMSVRLWDTTTGKCTHILEGHNREVKSIEYSPHGEMIATASDDKSVRLWDVKSGQCQLVIEDFHGAVNSIHWAEESGVLYLLTGCQDAVRKWGLKRDDGSYYVRLCWSSMNNTLAVTDAMIRDVQGLSSFNDRLMRQRGAVDGPIPHSRRSSGTSEDSSPTVTASEEHPDQQVEAAKGLNH